jgi:hypothetical protein
MQDLEKKEHRECAELTQSGHRKELQNVSWTNKRLRQRMHIAHYKPSKAIQAHTPTPY